jgi:hypothetical protein
MATRPITTECPHCGVTVCFEQKGAPIQNTYTDFIDSDDEVPARFEQTLYPGQCPSCRKLCLVGTEECEAWAEETEVITYPTLIKKPNPAFPKEIKIALGEIYKCESVQALKAVAVMSRRFLEQCCSTCGIKKGPLKEKINELLTKKYPNETLSRHAHLVKCMGDEGAHAFGDVAWDEAKASVLFCEELAHHLFITEKRFEKIVASRKKRGKKVD